MTKVKTNTWLLSDELSGAAMGLPAKTPILPNNLQTVWRMALNPTCIGLSIGEGKRFKTSYKLVEDLSSAPDLTVYTDLRELSILFCSTPERAHKNFVMWRKLLHQIGALRNVPKMELMVWDNEEPQGLESMLHWNELFEGVKELTTSFNGSMMSTYFPSGLPNLEKLELLDPIPVDVLLSISMPNLKSLYVKTLEGLQSIQQLTDAFPMLECIEIEDRRNSTSFSLKLGTVSPCLKCLSVETPLLGEWDSLAESNVEQLQFENCSFDPCFLQNCRKLRVLQLKNCMLQNDIPTLSELRQLDTLVINSCFVRDFGFAKGLAQMQVFNICGNKLDLSLQDLEEEQLPKEVECLQDMPNLIEFCMDEKDLQKVFFSCKEMFKKYELRPNGIMRLK